MRIILTIVLTILAGAALAQSPPIQRPADCPLDKPCSVAVDADGQVVDKPKTREGSFQRIGNGPDMLSLEETAASYFEQVAEQAARNLAEDHPFNPKNRLRDRDGLTQAEAAEVIAVAQRLNAPPAPQARRAATEQAEASKRADCQALNRATTPDALLAELEAGEAAFVKARARKGKELLDALSPATRARMLDVLTEYRKSMTVGRQDWKKVREVRPEAMESYRAAKCSGVN